MFKPFLIGKISEMFVYPDSAIGFNLLLLLLLLEALQLQRSFGLLNEFLPFDLVSDAVLPVC
jgi:hypothetical protein